MSEPGAGGLLRRNPNLYFYYSTENALLAEIGTADGRLEAPRDVLDILDLVDGTRTEADVAAAVAWPGLDARGRAERVRDIVSRLEAKGLLLGGAGEAQSTREAAGWGYSRPDIHRTMLQDSVRTEAFRKALHEVVTPGATVIDMGTGTGVLAMFAAQAGAGAVHAIESTSIIEQARRIARLNGLDQIQFHEGDAESLELDLQADVLVSEWLGHFVFISDGMFPAMATLRDRCLRPGGTVVPSRVDIYLAPMSDTDRQSVGFWAERPYGIDFTPVLEEELRLSQVRLVPAEALLARPAVVKTIDCVGDQPGDLTFSARGAFTIEREGGLHGFCGHFTAQLSPGVLLDTGPEAPPTHWQQHFFPIRPIPVRPGDRVEVTLKVDQDAYDRRIVHITLTGAVIQTDGRVEAFEQTYVE